jgi:hypothetical protein
MVSYGISPKALVLTTASRIDNALRQWSARYLESLDGLKDLRVALRLPNLMREAGFVDVEHRMIQLHTCAWSTGVLRLVGVRVKLDTEMYDPTRSKRQRNRCG